MYFWVAMIICLYGFIFYDLSEDGFSETDRLAFALSVVAGGLGAVGNILYNMVLRVKRLEEQEEKRRLEDIYD